MATTDQWLDAIKEANCIKESFDGKHIILTHYVEGFYQPKEYRCEVIQVNPCESFDDKDKFDFYVILAEINNHNNYQRAFLLEKIKPWMV